MATAVWVRWLAYEQEASYFRGYLPDPDELDERIDTCRTLRELGVTADIADAVLVHGTLPIWMVRNMVGRYGAVGACLRLEQFLEDRK